MEEIPVFDKRVGIDWKGGPEEVLLKKPTFGKRNEAIKKATNSTFVDNKLKRELDETELKEWLLVFCIVKAPFPVTIEGVRDLPYEIGDKLLNELEDLMSVKEAVKKN